MEEQHPPADSTRRIHAALAIDETGIAGALSTTGGDNCAIDANETGCDGRSRSADQSETAASMDYRGTSERRTFSD